MHVGTGEVDGEYARGLTRGNPVAGSTLVTTKRKTRAELREGPVALGTVCGGTAFKRGERSAVVRLPRQRHVGFVLDANEVSQKVVVFRCWNARYEFVLQAEGRNVTDIVPVDRALVANTAGDEPMSLNEFTAVDVEGPGASCPPCAAGSVPWAGWAGSWSEVSLDQPPKETPSNCGDTRREWLPDTRVSRGLAGVDRPGAGR